MRTCLWLCGALLGVQFAGAPPALAAYTIKLTETVSSGAAGASPDLTFRVTIPLTAETTGHIVLHVDARHFGPSGTRRALARLAAAKAGTVIGFASYSFDPARAVYSQVAVVLGSAPRQTAGGSPVLSAVFGQFELPDSPFRIAAGRAGELTISADVRRMRAYLHQHGSIEGGLDYFEFRLLGTIAGATNGRIVVNPRSPRSLRDSAEAFTCVGLACGSEALGARASASIRLPKRVTFSAPQQFVYGYPTVFTGTGRPGDVVQLFMKSIRRVPFPVPGARAIVARDGRFSITARPRTWVIPRASGPLPIAHATTRFVVAVTSGAGTIMVEAGRISRARLVAPRLLRPRTPGSLLVFIVSLSGAGVVGRDSNAPPVTVRVMRSRVEVARGTLDASGRYAATILDGVAGRYRAIVTVPGATAAGSNTVTVRSAAMLR